MIKFTKCTVTPDGKKLIVEACVSQESYYDNVYIDCLSIDTEDTFNPIGPSKEPLFTTTFQREVEVDNPDWTPDNGEPETIIEIVRDFKNISLEFTPDMLGLSSFDNLYFIHIKALGAPSPDVPCGADNIYTLGVAMNLVPVYNMQMGYLKELEHTCTIPKGFIDSILKSKALELALKTGNNLLAAKYWTKLFKDKGVNTVKSCGCNGN